MPAAVVNTEDSERHDLKSAPPDGFVLLKRMTYGQVVQRRSMLKMSVSGERGKNKSFAGELAMANKEITMFEYATCIIDHNLEDGEGKKLELGRMKDFDRLDPRVGQEIEGLIAEMNNFDDEEAEGN